MAKTPDPRHETIRLGLRKLRARRQRLEAQAAKRDDDELTALFEAYDAGVKQATIAADLGRSREHVARKVLARKRSESPDHPASTG